MVTYRHIDVALPAEHYAAIRTLVSKGNSISRWIQRAVMAAIEAKDVEIGEPHTAAEELAQDVIIRERAARIRKRNSAGGWHVRTLGR